MNSKELNEQLLKVSKKFNKACNQIKLIKQEMARCVTLLNYYDTVESTSNGSQECPEQEPSSLTIKTSSINYTLFKQHLSFKLDSLKNVQSAYFVYAHRKADEITRLQCEIYGEEAVREAYETAPPEVLVPVDTHDQTSNQETNINEETTNDNESNEEEETNWSNPDYSNWNWGLNQYPEEEAYVNNHPNQNSLYLEYDFLTA